MNVYWALAAYLVCVSCAVMCFVRAQLRFGPTLMNFLFSRHPEFSAPANRLVVTGLELFAWAAAAFLIKVPQGPFPLTSAAELTAGKCGQFLLILAAIHLVRFKNLLCIYARWRENERWRECVKQTPVAQARQTNRI